MSEYAELCKRLLSCSYEWVMHREAADAIESLTKERDALLKRDKQYLGPDCHGFIGKEGGYVPACTTYKADLAEAKRDAERMREALREIASEDPASWQGRTAFDALKDAP